jgi:hypothetical protein
LLCFNILYNDYCKVESSWACLNKIIQYPLVKFVNSVLGIAFNLAVNWTISDYGIDGAFLLILSLN